MIIRAKGLLFDSTNPERVFKEGTYLKINDPERAKRLVRSGLGIEEDPGKEDVIELDPKPKPKKK